MAKVGVDIVITEKGGQVLKRTGRDIDEVGKRTKALSARFGGLAKSWVVAAAAAAGMALAMKKFISLSNVQEEAEASLSAALRARGIVTKEAIDDLKKFASSMQEVTGIGDEMTLAVMAQLTVMGLQGESLKLATLLSADLAVVMKTDIKSAARVMADAFAGSTGMLGRYIKGLDMADIKQRGAISIIEQLTTAIGGQAEAFGTTGAGQIAIFNAALGDTGEVVGDLVKDILIKVLPALRAVVDILGPTMMSVIAAVQLAFAALFAAILKPLALVEEGMDFLGISSDRTFRRLVNSAEKLVVTYSKDLVDAVVSFGGTGVGELKKIEVATLDLVKATEKLAKKQPERLKVKLPKLPKPEGIEDVVTAVDEVKEQFVDLSVTAADVGFLIESSFQQAASGMVSAMFGAKIEIDQILRSIAASFIQLGIRHFVGGALGFAAGGPIGAAAGAVTVGGGETTTTLGKRGQPGINVVLEGTIEGQEFQQKTFPDFTITRSRRQF